MKLRRSSNRTLRKYRKYILFIIFLYVVIDFVILIRRSSPRSPKLTIEEQERLEKKRANRKPPKIFISSTHWNNEIRLRGFWNNAILDLAEHFGPKNVYVSIYESGSWDDSKGALRELDAKLEALGVQRTITLDETSHSDAIAEEPAPTGWIQTPRGKKELRRIPYLAKLRNLTLKPITKLALNGIRYDKILFLNDVYFTTGDIVTLLDTRDGEYAAACSLDFMRPPSYYDTFALRDSSGHQPITSTFPFFRSRASRSAMIAGQPVPVQSCWNGAVVFNARPFYNALHPLLFRGISDSLAEHHLEGSECCLIHYDNPLTEMDGVWVNPNVRVGYSIEAYNAVHPFASTNSSGGGVPDPWPSATDRWFGLWKNRFARWLTSAWWEKSKLRRRVRQWKAGRDVGSRMGNVVLGEQEVRNERGVECLIDEMQVLVYNGWAHV